MLKGNRHLNLGRLANGTVCVLCAVLVVSAVLVCALSVSSLLFGADVTSVRITDGNSVTTVTAKCDTVEDALVAAGYDPEDVVLLNCRLDDKAEDVETIKIDAGNTNTDTETTDVETLIHFDEYVEPTPVPTAEPEATQEPAAATAEPETKKPVIEVYYEDKVSELGYETTYTYDTTMNEGTSRVVSDGKNGTKTTVYEYTKVDGVITNTVIVKEYVSSEPVNKVVALGTISTFVNSRGETVGFSNCISCTGTAYTYSEKWVDALYYGAELGGLTARWGVIAVDPNVIPLGTKVYVKSTDGTDDYGYAIAADIGGSIKGNKIDCWMDNAPLSFCWGVRSVEVYILSDQSVDVFALRGDDQWDDPHTDHCYNIYN